MCDRPEVQKMLQELLEIQCLGALVHQRDHIAWEDGLQVGLLVQVIDNHLGVSTPS